MKIRKMMGETEICVQVCSTPSFKSVIWRISTTSPPHTILFSRPKWTTCVQWSLRAPGQC